MDSVSCRYINLTRSDFACEPQRNSWTILPVRRFCESAGFNDPWASHAGFWVCGIEMMDWSRYLLIRAAGTGSGEPHLSLFTHRYVFTCFLSQLPARVLSCAIQPKPQIHWRIRLQKPLINHAAKVPWDKLNSSLKVLLSNASNLPPFAGCRMP